MDIREKIEGRTGLLFLYKNFTNKILLRIIRGDRLFCQLKDRGAFCDIRIDFYWS